MHAITEADREAAKALREILAEISGFWHKSGDDGPLCQALARHRSEGEQRFADKLAPFLTLSPPGKGVLGSLHSAAGNDILAALPRTGT
ncbi:MAG TPA: hypothetical protein VF499_09515 [Afipia sp.]